MNALHDRAFDKGYITLDEKLRVVVGTTLRLQAVNDQFVRRSFINFEGRKILNPERFDLDKAALEWHRNSVFIG
ncbi:MAG: hypothetical protein P9L92_16740 [Candidatus Electryonea clarkiae]|nr:hypothetical protein [Candidatus Electryonea clarkiae]MDP8285437.1 hypothetical protein [Candidatus Electryonea clarkiae]